MYGVGFERSNVGARRRRVAMSQRSVVDGIDRVTACRSGRAESGRPTLSSTLKGADEMRTEDTLAKAWDAHLTSEFVAKSPEQALATMTAEPYVNEIPLMIGARGRDEVRDFYANHFLSQIPPDMETVPVSRTVGQDQVVDELILRFTHSIRMDWLLPGIPPTGNRLEVPTVPTGQSEGDRAAHEPIYLHQAPVLAQAAHTNPPPPVRGGKTAAQVLNPPHPINNLTRRATPNPPDRPPADK